MYSYVIFLYRVGTRYRYRIIKFGPCGAENPARRCFELQSGFRIQIHIGSAFVPGSGSNICITFFHVNKHYLIFRINQALDPDPYPQLFQTLDTDSDPHEMDADPKPGYKDSKGFHSADAYSCIM